MSLSLIRTLIQEIFIQEKRKFPVEDRIKQETTDVLDKYVDKGYFFHLTNDYSLQGLNVGGEFDTPLGIYTYPLTNNFYNSETKEISVPFAGKRKYIIILKLKNDKNFVKSSTYSKNDLMSDGQKLDLKYHKLTMH